MGDLHLVVLAAGKGTRMKSARAKVLHRVGGSPMIERVLDVARALNPASTVVVVGHQAAAVQSALARRRDLVFVVQEPQLGTAHAVLTAERVLANRSGNVLLLSGDVPLLNENTLKILINRHESTHAAATVLSAFVDEPEGYGRIVRSGEEIARIVEQKDATAAEQQIREINTGVYVFALEGLFAALRAIAPDNAQREFYLPDLVAIYRKNGRRVEVVTSASPDEIRGINSRGELAAMNRIVRDRKNAALMAAGVTLDDPDTAYVGPDVEIGADTILRPVVTLEGATHIGDRCEIHTGVRIVNSTLGDDVTILDHCVIVDARIAPGATIGPFAHLRPGVEVGTRAKIGNFVELKNTVLGPGSKSMHLAYLGDAVIGEKVNIGAGTITCNYDGSTKSTTTIEDGAFVGSDSQLVAPVRIGKGAYVGSGSTIRENVPAGALAVSAGKQRNIEGWVETRSRGDRKKDKGQRAEGTDTGTLGQTTQDKGRKTEG